MRENNEVGLSSPAADAVVPIQLPGGDVLTGILRDGAQRLLGQAIDAEVEAWIERHAGLKDDRGRQQVVKNGHHPTRRLVTASATPSPFPATRR